MLAIGAAQGTLLGVLATAIFTGGMLIVSIMSHRLERAKSGTSNAIIVTQGRKSLPWSEFDPVVLPEGWPRDQFRWTPVRFVNRGTSPMAVLGPVRATVGFRRREVGAGYFQVIVPQDEPKVAPLLLRDDRWGSKKKCRVRVEWEAGGGTVWYRGSVSLKALPSEAPSPLPDPKT